MENIYRYDRGWSDTRLPEVKKILAENFGEIDSVDTSSIYQDLKEATDIVIRMKEGNRAVGVRVRRPNYDFRDFTVRSMRKSKTQPGTETPTEMHKFLEPTCPLVYYFYGWLNAAFEMDEWMIMDFQKMRALDLFNKEKWGWKEIPNKDQETAFFPIPGKFLLEKDCLINFKCVFPK